MTALRIKTETCEVCGNDFSFKVGFGLGATRRKTCTEKCRKVRNRVIQRQHQRKRNPIAKRDKWRKSLYSVADQDDFIILYDLLYEAVDENEIGFSVTNDDIERTAQALVRDRESRLADGQL